MMCLCKIQKLKFFFTKGTFSWTKICSIYSYWGFSCCWDSGERTRGADMRLLIALQIFGTLLTFHQYQNYAHKLYIPVFYHFQQMVTKIWALGRGFQENFASTPESKIAKEITCSNLLYSNKRNYRHWGDKKETIFVNYLFFCWFNIFSVKFA